MAFSMVLSIIAKFDESIHVNSICRDSKDSFLFNIGNVYYIETSHLVFLVIKI